MIKKFNKFIKESKDDIRKIPKEDIEDQFLRLKEIIGCDIYVQYRCSDPYGKLPNHYFYDGILVNVEFDTSSESSTQLPYMTFKRDNVRSDLKVISSEIEKIENRLENMYNLYVVDSSSFRGPNKGDDEDYDPIVHKGINNLNYFEGDFIYMTILFALK